MRWFVFSLFLICVSAQAQVVCKDPNSVGGDEVAEAGSAPTLCRTNVTNASQGAVDIEVNPGSHVANLVPAVEVKADEKPTKTAPSSTSGDESGTIQ